MALAKVIIKCELISHKHLLPVNYKEQFKLMINQVDLWINTKGPKWTIARIKLIRVLVHRYLSGNPILIINEELIGLTHDGLPKALGPLIDSVRSKSPQDIRLVLTILEISKLIDWWGDPDLDPITNPPKIDLDPAYAEFQTYFDRIWNHFQITPINTDWDKPHLTTKAGPMGVALTSALTEAKLLPSSLKQSIQTIGGDNLLAWIDKVSKIPVKDSEEPKGKITLRKLSVIRDPEAKSRVIAIYDYWSQTCLRPIHDGLLSILSRIPADCTLDQGQFTSRMSGHEEYFSIDLKSCTDRFPVGLQESIMSRVLGSKEKASSWRDILCAHEFYVPWTGESVLYRTGQPMGAYSSWAAMALSHHFVVKWAALSSGKPVDWDAYFLLGDDLVIMDRQVALEYKRIIHSLGVEISESKTLESKDSFEFAKRFFYKGVEVSHWPLRALIENTSKYYMLAAILVPLIRKGYIPFTDGGPELGFLLKGYYTSLNLPVNQAGRLGRKCRALLTLILLSQDLNQGRREDWSAKAFNLASILRISVGCNREKFLPVFLLEVILTVRANIVRDRIVENAKRVNSFLSEWKSQSMCSNEDLHGSNAYSLVEHPVYRVACYNIADLQGMLDDMRSQARQQDWRSLSWSTKHVALVDPTGLSTRRANMALAGSIAVTLNKVKALWRSIQEVQQSQLASDDCNSPEA